MSTEMLDAALDYARRGLPVFPVVPGGKTPLISKADGGNGCLDATTDEALILAWWTKYPTANVGIRCGAVSGWTVLDVDIKNGVRGDLTLEGLVTLNGPLPKTLTQRTWSGGMQMVFKYVPGATLSAGKVGAGLDIRNDNGYVVVPPSRVRSTGGSKGTYTWEIEREPAEMPQWLVSLIKAPGMTTNGKPPFTLPEKIPTGQRNDTVYKLARSLKAKGLSEAAIRSAVSTENDTRCEPPISVDELDSLLKNAWTQADQPDFQASTLAGSKSPAGYRLTDTGNAERFRDQHQHHARYCPERKKWYVFNKQIWVPDLEGLAVDQMMKETLLALYEDSRALGDEAGQRLRKWAAQCESAGRRHAALELAKSEMPIRASVFDANPDILNCLNGVLDLQTLQLRAAQPDDYCTMLTGAPFDPAATDAIWDRFLTEKVPDTTTRGWFQRAMGYTLTGKRDQDFMLNVYGPPRTGKTTCAEGVCNALGDYGAVAHVETFTVNRGRDNGAGNRPDLARLPGKRLVISAETSEHHRLDEELVKGITGCDTLTACAKYENPFTFTPCFTWMVYGNERIRVTDNTTAAIWTRIAEIPFDQTVTAIDPAIRDHVLFNPQAHAAILRWAVDGLRLYRVGRKLKPFPPQVQASVKNYQQDMNTLKPFIEARCILDQKARISAADLTAAYEQWADRQRVPPKARLSDKQRAARLRDLDCIDRLNQGRTYWVGIKLREEGSQ